MSKILAKIIAAVTVCAPGAVAAQSCESLLNTQIAPVSFEAAARSLTGGASLTKDEFETTAQFEERLAAARSGMPSSVMVSLPVDMEQISYNADTAAFDIKTYAVANLGADWFSVFYGSPYYTTIGSGISSGSNALGVVLSSEDNATGTYTGKNGYGAEWEITEVTRELQIIFEGKARNYGSTLFQSNAGSAPVWSLPIPVEEARAFKANIRAAALIVPKAPYYFENTQGSTARITVQNPRDLTLESHVIVADIQCVVFTNETNNVVMSVRTN